MNLPLPGYARDIIEAQPSGAVPTLSLKFYKWAGIYESGYNAFSKDKTTYLLNFTELSKKREYTEAFDIRKKWMEDIGGITFDLTTATSLIIGMGYEHPLENGFLFDWTTGLPIIPGSSLKGVAGNFAEDMCTNDKCLETDFKTIFGDEKKKEAGHIIFMPAYPLVEENKPFLCQDVMTPHYSPYYRDPGNIPPADWYSPIPIPFLAVPKEITYRFRLVNRMNLTDTTSPLLEKAKEILQQTLKEEGVGAKTAVFYGYFK